MEVPEQIALCDLCKNIQNRSTVADGFCNECAAYMCKGCLKDHLLFKISMNHVLSPLGGGQKKLAQERVKLENCKLHTEETVKYYCRLHDAIACVDCVVVDHRQCDVEFIRDLAKNMQENSDYKDVLRSMQRLEAETKAYDNQWRHNQNENTALVDKAVDKIRKFRKELNNYLDHSEKKIIDEAQQLSKENKKKMSDLEEKITSITHKISALTDSLDPKSCPDKILFTRLIECKPQVHQVEKTLSEIKGMIDIKSFTFVPAVSLRYILNTRPTIGYLKTNWRLASESNPRAHGFDVGTKVEYVRLLQFFHEMERRLKQSLKKEQAEWERLEKERRQRKEEDRKRAEEARRQADKKLRPVHEARSLPMFTSAPKSLPRWEMPLSVDLGYPLKRTETGLEISKQEQANLSQGPKSQFESFGKTEALGIETAGTKYRPLARVLFKNLTSQTDPIQPTQISTALRQLSLKNPQPENEDDETIDDTVTKKRTTVSTSKGILTPGADFKTTMKKIHIDCITSYMGMSENTLAGAISPKGLILVDFLKLPHIDSSNQDPLETLISILISINTSLNCAGLFIPKVVFGKKVINCIMTTENIESAKKSGLSVRVASKELIKLETEEITLEDFVSESSHFRKLLLLNAVCEAYRKEHSCTLKALPCTRTNDEQGEKLVLLAINREQSRPEEEEYRGFAVLKISLYESSDESIEAENHARELSWQNSPVDKQQMSKVIEFHTESLFKLHSNLEVIGASAVKSAKGEYRKQPTITLYCRRKSMIPYGENPFPKTLKHPSRHDIEYDTDVREGYFMLAPRDNVFQPRPCDFHQELAMGCSIGPENGKYSGSLGPFVQLEGDTNVYFLTVRHVLQPLSLPGTCFEGCNIDQPAAGDRLANPSQSVSSHQSGCQDRNCGKVVKAVFDESIDVALVRILNRTPKRGHFINFSIDELAFAGFSLEDFPRYDDGAILDATKFTTDTFATERVVKFGKTTGLTKGTLELNCTAVKVFDENACSISHEGNIQTKIMKQQLRVNSHHSSQGKRFFDAGDSGSAVFLVDKKNKLYCIGMAIGCTNDGYTVVTPINALVDRLSHETGRTVEIKEFPFETMDDV